MYLSFTSLPHVVLLLLAHLTLVMASDDSLVATEPKGSQPDYETCLYQVAGRIAHHLSAEDDAHFSMACREISFRSAPSMKEHRKKFFVGDNPSYIQAVKHCMHLDDVECYNSVTTFFTNLGQVEEYHKQQLPQLAARLDAPNIFQVLKVDPNTQIYRRALIRSLLGRQERFFYTIGDIEPIVRYRRPKRYDMYYSTSQLLFLYGQDLKEIEGYKTGDLLYDERNDLDEYQAYYDQNISDHPDDFDGFVTNPGPTFPTIWNISQVLDNPDIEARREQIDALKKRIIDVLALGSFIMDDIVLNVRNTAWLWWQYAKPLGSATNDDGGASDFIYWLIGEGAPLNELPFVWYYGVHMDQTRFKELLRVLTLYNAGGPTQAMNLYLDYTLDHKPKPSVRTMHMTLSLYKAIGADLFGRNALRKIIIWLSTPPPPPADGYGYAEIENPIQFKEWFLGMGLTESKLDVAVKQLEMQGWHDKNRVVSEWKWMIHHPKSQVPHNLRQIRVPRAEPYNLYAWHPH